MSDATAIIIPKIVEMIASVPRPRKIASNRSLRRRGRGERPSPSDPPPPPFPLLGGSGGPGGPDVPGSIAI